MRLDAALEKTLSLLSSLSPRKHIRARIILPYAVLCIVMAVVGTYLATQMIAGSLQERFDNQLAEAGRVAADGVVRAEQKQLKEARAMAYTEGAAEAAKDGDATRLQSLISPLAANEGVDRAEVVDANGTLLVDIVSEGSPPADPASGANDPKQWAIVQQVLGGTDALGDKYASIVQTDRGFYLVTAAPLALNGLTAGAVLVGTPLTELVAEVKAQALADVTFYSYDGRALASTFVQTDEGSDGADLTLSPTLMVATLNAGGSSPREGRNLFGRDYDFAYGRLTVRQTVVGLYSVSLPKNFILSAGATTRLKMSFLFGAAIAAVLAIGYLSARQITGPILKLVHASQSVAAGDLQTRTPIQSNDELGMLAKSFDQMTESLQERTEQLLQHNLNTVKAFTSAVDARDPYTLGHSVRVGQLSALLARQLGLPDELRDEIELGGYLHDIGKIGVRDSVLLKPGPLTTEERLGIDYHPLVGCRILESLDLSSNILEFVRSHHERIDGSGYPDGLRGNDLSLVARIAAVADVYDAMTSERPYKAALTPEAALAEIKSQANKKLDAKVIAALEVALPEWERLQNEAGLRDEQEASEDAQSTSWAA